MARFSLENSSHDNMLQQQHQEDPQEFHQHGGILGGDPVICIPSVPQQPPPLHHTFGDHDNSGSNHDDYEEPYSFVDNQLQHNYHETILPHNSETIHHVDDVVQELDNVINYFNSFQTETSTTKATIEQPRAETRERGRRKDHMDEQSSINDRRNSFAHDKNIKAEHTRTIPEVRIQRKFYEKGRKHVSEHAQRSDNNMHIDLTGVRETGPTKQQDEQLTPTTVTDNSSSRRTRHSPARDDEIAEQQPHNNYDTKEAATTTPTNADNPEESSWEELKALIQTTENVLHGSPEQRESARSWAMAMKQSVLKWVKEQHTLIECERRRVASEMKEAESCIQNQNLKVTNDLTNTVHHLKSELQNESEKYKQTIKQLDTIIQRQQERIKFLEEELVNTRHEVLQDNQEEQPSPTSVANFQSPALDARKQDKQKGQRAATPRNGEKHYDSIFRPTSATPRTRNQNRPLAVETMTPSPVPNNGKHHQRQPTVPLPPVQQHQEDTARIPRRVEKVFPDGLRVIHYRNGSKKEIFPDGKKVLYFHNGDIKTIFTDDSGLVSYYYASTKTTHKMDPKGVDIYEYPNSQVEMHYADGRKKIQFPDGTVKKIFCDGTTEMTFNDGIQVMEYPDGTKVCVRF